MTYVPPMLTLPATPRPPVVTIAPVDVLVLTFVLLTINTLPIVPPLNCCCSAATATQLRLPAPSVDITKLVDPPVILTLLIEPSDVIPFTVALPLTVKLPVTATLPVVSICTLVCPPVLSANGR